MVLEVGERKANYVYNCVWLSGFLGVSRSFIFHSSPNTSSKMSTTSTTKFPNLFKALQMGDLTLKNRMALAPMTRARCPGYLPTKLVAEYYKQRAGAGLVITEATNISEVAIGWMDTPGLYTDEQVEAWKPVVEAVHERNSAFFAQLWHTGRQSHSSFHPGKRIVSASNVTMTSEQGTHTAQGTHEPHEEPRPLELEEIPSVVEEYRKAAENALKAGFDGVEIHAANGYLIDQFLQSKTNKRTDAYGGSIENRYRFLGEVVEAVATTVPLNRIGVRLSPNGAYGDMGSPDFREQFLYVVKKLGEAGIGYVHFCDGLEFGFHKLGEPMTLDEVRPLLTEKTLLMASTGYTAEKAEARIEAGLADLVSFGRPFLANPDLPERYYYDLPLAELAPFPTWFIPNQTEEGFTDFPAHADVPSPL
eukprot:m.143095 g.143095  ORF g.143095 m.143095 type:complete len:419 (+) comp14081_c2_seq1:362-1618(+)